MGPPAAGPLYEPVLMLPIFIYLSSLYRNNNNNIGNNNYYKHTSNNDKSMQTVNVEMQQTVYNDNCQ